MLVVEGYLYANRTLDTIRIAETANGDRPFYPGPVLGADVSLETNGVTYKLTGLEGRPGIYTYTGSNLVIKPGATYHLTVKSGDRALAAQTAIPSSPPNPALTNDTIIVTGTVTPLNISKTYTLLTWNQTASYTFIMRKYTEKDTVTIDLPGFGIDHYTPYYLQKPFNGSFAVIPMTDFRYYGTYKFIICQVNDDFLKLFEEPGGTQLPGPVQTNIDGGYGIFTGISCDTVTLEVVKGE